MNFNVNELRKDFPILKKKINGKNLIYFDSGATSLTPKPVTDAILNYYENYNANYSRGVATISNNLTIKIENIRKKTANFIGVSDAKNIVFTKNTTESINIIANGLVNYLKPGDEIVISQQEHHANILPWIVLAQKTKAILKYIPISLDGTLQVEELEKLVTSKTKIFSLNQISSTLGYVNDIKQIAKKVKSLSNAFVVIDGAQSCGHINVKMTNDIDAFVFSAHKMFGPTGVGVLYINDLFTNIVEPLNFGGQMVDLANQQNFSIKGLPFKYEAGTLNLSGIFGFGAALDYLNKYGIDNISRYIDSLTKYFATKIKDLPNIFIFNDLSRSHGIISLNLAQVHSHESSSDLDKLGIQTRAGTHCSQIYFATQKQDNNVRISLYAYNTFEEIDFLVDSLQKIANKWASITSNEYDYQKILAELKKLKQTEV